MKIIGHRGARGLAPENTLAAFEAALQQKVDGVEFDVHVTKDGMPVTQHDPFIVQGKDKLLIRELTYTQLNKLQPDLPTLKQTLKFLGDKTELVIEIKSGVDTKPIIACLQSDLQATSVIVSSFDMRMLSEVKAAMPEVEVAVNEKWSGVRAGHRARKLGTKYITMNQRWLWSGFIRSVAKRGYKVSSYTINNPAQARKWAKVGLYAAITDYPDRFLDS